MNKRQKKKHGLLNAQLKSFRYSLEVQRVQAALLHKHAQALVPRCDVLEGRLREEKHRADELKKYTVRFGIERGRFDDPTFGIQVWIHPMEFKMALRGDGVMNISWRAERVGRELGDKVSRALVDFVNGKEFR